MLATIIFFFALLVTIIFTISGIAIISFLNADIDVEDPDIDWVFKVFLYTFIFTGIIHCILWSYLYHLSH